MRIFTGKRLYATAFALALALVLGIVTYISAAAGTATLDILGVPKDTPCGVNGKNEAAIMQDSPVKFSLAGYNKNEKIAMYVTFPDGRVLDLPAVITLDGPVNTDNIKVPSPLSVDEGGDLFFVYKTSNKWPVGCYSVTTLGLSSGLSDTIAMVVTGTPSPDQKEAHLATVNEKTGDPNGPRDSNITMKGTDFQAGEAVSITITAPDGTTNDFPNQLTTSKSGAFTITFKFSDANLIGKYTFVAQGEASGYIAKADYVLEPPSANGSPNPARLKAIVSVDPQNPLARRIELQGTFFQPSEGVTLKLTLPTLPAPTLFGTIISLPAQRINEQGKFSTMLELDQRFPTGVYSLKAEGSDGHEVAVVNFVIPATQTDTIGAVHSLNDDTTSVMTNTTTMTATTSTMTPVTPTKAATVAPAITSTTVPSTTNTTVPPTAVPPTAVPPVATATTNGSPPPVVTATQTGMNNGDDPTVIIIYNPQNGVVGQVLPPVAPATGVDPHDPPAPAAPQPTKVSW